MSDRPLLIVDDEPQNLAVLRQILMDDYRLLYARNGSDALATARKHRPCLVLLDIEMPDMDGYQVCNALQTDPATRDIPVIFVTGLAEVGHEARGFACGAVDYIVKPVSAEIVRARVANHLSLVRAAALQRSHLDGIAMLAEAGHYNDSDTGLHIWRMAGYTRALAAASGWKLDACNLIEQAAPMHDTGKIGIPEGILRKPGRLDAGEWAIMQTHCRIGHRILSKSEAPVFRMAAEVALFHHEKWDGNGYPEGLAGDDIPESARIVAIADVFDALTMQRPYKEPWSVERAMATLREGAGRHFEPRLVELFENILGEILLIKEEWDGRE